MSKVEAIELKEAGNKAFAEKDYLQALLNYTKAIKVDRNNASLWGNRAAAYYNLGIYEKAIEDSNYAIELQPKTSKFYWRKGISHLALGQNYAAKLAFQNGLRQEPGNDQLRKALDERQPGEPTYEGKLANLSWEQKREKAIELKDVGNKLFGSRKYNEAIAKYGEAIEMDPSDSIFYNNRAACYTEINKIDEAIKDCQFAIVLGDTNGVCNLGRTTNAEPRLQAKAYTRLGIAYEKKNQFKEAAQAYRDGLQFENSEPLQQKLAAVIKRV
ncbi:MAG: putative stress induced phosphoprotein 1 [Streblomastix strix]|uniref:Putative stress induced phosphoprotein 1 n=1 Tax=Streblomastix strix TaxID=222440 RepID=A0A5J4W8Y4_9EUKA|nr:MAG: putative stress induced phosphoprotein 1 [Streblomastix strix]